MGKLVPFRRAGGKEAGDPALGAAPRGFRLRIGLGGSRSSDARPSPAFASDARRSEAGGAADGGRDLERRQRLQRRVRNLLLGAVFLGGCVAAFVGERGFLDGRRARRELEAIERLVTEQEGKVVELRLQAERLRHEPSALERIAREQLGLVRPGEIVVLFADPEPRSSLAAPGGPGERRPGATRADP